MISKLIKRKEKIDSKDTERERDSDEKVERLD